MAKMTSLATENSHFADRIKKVCPFEGLWKIGGARFPQHVSAQTGCIECRYDDSLHALTPLAQLIDHIEARHAGKLDIGNDAIRRVDLV